MADRPESLLAGRTLAGRYDILALIGVGGMGAVYRARDRELDELIALKVIREELAHDPVVVERFRHEVKLARRVTHANVARTYELGHADDLMFCTMELIEGESLTRRLARHRRLSVAEAATIACAVCDALAAAHAVGVIHRDIKPDNVLIASSGRVVLADFGIASAGAAGIADVSGTPAYMAPEQTRGEPPTPATDVYAVGVLLHEMITGTRAFAGDMLAIFAAKQAAERLEVSPSTDVDAELAEVIGAATAREPAQRIATAAALRARIAGWAKLAALGVEVEPVVQQGELPSVVVLAPRADQDTSRLYLADAVFEQLLRTLQRSRLRVLPRMVARVDGTEEPGATQVELLASDVLTVRISSPAAGDLVTLRLPLAVEQIADAAEAASAAITTSLALQRPRRRVPSSEALDLLLQARHLGQRDLDHLTGAIELLTRANALLPDDPRIMANLAIQQVRHAFFSPAIADELLGRSRALVRVALAAGPRLTEAHLAAGHLELNVGEASVAAGHYRVAIACSPHVAEAHESLGRMLLEAGFLEPALARIAEALAIAPGLHGIRWDVARALALEARWEEHAQVLAELEARNLGNPTRSGPLRLRFAAWRGDLPAIERLRVDARPDFESVLYTAAFDIYEGAPWEPYRDKLIAVASRGGGSVRRRRAFIAQLVAEVAGFAGDVDTCVALIQRATDDGLFDLHWLDRCPLLAGARSSPAFAAQRARVKQRADAVLDALYGDHDVGATSDTVAASMSDL